MVTILAYIIVVIFYAHKWADSEYYRIEKAGNIKATYLAQRAYVIMAIVLFLFTEPPLEFTFVNFLIFMFIGATLFWIIFDILLNLKRGKKWYYLNNTGTFDRFASWNWIIKTICLFFSLIFIYELWKTFQ